LILTFSGTGKNTVAGHYASVLKELGLLSKGGVVVIPASSLVGGFFTKTADVVKEACIKAQGNVMVIKGMPTLLGDFHGDEVSSP
jgi:hypothetical protein